MSPKKSFAIALTALPFVAACYSGNTPAFANGLPSTDGDGGVALVASDVPCDVANVLQEFCIRCHNGGALSASKLALNSYAALTRDAGSGGTDLELALARVADAKDPMPPRGEPGPAQSDIQTLQAWAAANYPTGDCKVGSTSDGGTDGNGDFASVYDTPVSCSSGSHWTGGNQESAGMHPGGTCVACHATGEGPRFDVAGTVYATAHEPTDCNGSNVAVTVIIIDATGRELSLQPNTVGNFNLRRSGLSMPYKARVERAGLMREMVSMQTSGDCNSCHTEAGTNKAPGRIMIP
jgi:hypothetical protein